MAYSEKPADSKIVSYLESIDGSARPAEIAEAIGLSQNYVTERCRMMAEADLVQREEGGAIIGHDIPGLESPVILKSDKSYLFEIVERVAPERLSEVRDDTMEDLRQFIKQELATNTYPLPNRKVSYAIA